MAIQPMAAYSGRRPAGRRPRRPARLPHPDHHRRAAVRDRHRRHGPARAAQRPGHVRPGRRGRRRRVDAAARQDRHHHLRQPAGRPSCWPPRASTTTGSPGRHTSRRSPTRRPRGARSSSWRRRRSTRHAGARSTGCPGRRDVRRVQRRDPDVGRRPARRHARTARARPTRSSRWVDEPRRRRCRAACSREVDGIATSGGTPLVVAVQETGRPPRVLGVVHLKDVVKPGMTRALRRSCAPWGSDRDDHGRQPADRHGRSRPRPGSTTSSPRRRPRTRWPSSSGSRTAAGSSP